MRADLRFNIIPPRGFFIAEASLFMISISSCTQPPESEAHSYIHADKQGSVAFERRWLPYLPLGIAIKQVHLGIKQDYRLTVSGPSQTQHPDNSAASLLAASVNEARLKLRKEFVRRGEHAYARWLRAATCFEKRLCKLASETLTTQEALSQFYALLYQNPIQRLSPTRLLQYLTEGPPLFLTASDFNFNDCAMSCSEASAAATTAATDSHNNGEIDSITLSERLAEADQDFAMCMTECHRLKQEANQNR